MEIPVRFYETETPQSDSKTQKPGAQNNLARAHQYSHINSKKSCFFARVCYIRTPLKHHLRIAGWDHHFKPLKAIVKTHEKNSHSANCLQYTKKQLKFWHYRRPASWFLFRVAMFSRKLWAGCTKEVGLFLHFLFDSFNSLPPWKLIHHI